jgi:hypothetical protein
MKETLLIASRMVVILSILLLLLQCRGNTLMTPTTGPTVITNLNDLAQLKQAFNSDQGRVRLVALLSPV